jgi:hypothetical protein
MGRRLAAHDDPEPLAEKETIKGRQALEKHSILCGLPGSIGPKEVNGNA